MNPVIYKVLFKGNNDYDYKRLVLTFKGLNIDKPIKIPTNFVLDLKKISESVSNILIFKNIDDVVKISQDTLSMSFNYHYAIIFELNQTREGLLMANIKKEGDILIGKWPFSEQQPDLSDVVLREKLNHILSNYKEYANICLIN